MQALAHWARAARTTTGVALLRLGGQIGLVAADQAQGDGSCPPILTRGEELCVDPGLELLD